MKSFDLDKVIGDVLLDAQIKDDMYVFHFGDADNSSFMVRKNLLSNEHLDSIISQDDRISGQIKNISGHYEVNESGEISSVTLTSRPNLSLNHYWGQSYFDDGSKDLVEMGITSLNLDLNDNSIGSFVKHILSDVEGGEYDDMDNN